MKNNKNFKNEILAIAEILDLGNTKTSNENLQMLCPFHEENKESFGINTSEGGYNCFACGGHGYISNLSNHLRGHILPHYDENILEYKIKTFIDGTGYKEKPKDKLGKIVNNIEDMNVNFTDYTIHDLIALIVKGHSISPSGAKKDEDWKQQQIVMLDFDNKNTNFTREEILEYAKKISLVPTFCYYTFSHLKGENPKEKFRFVYCFSRPITDRKQMNHILANLFYQFKEYEPDPQCKNLARVFVGTDNTNVELNNYLYAPTTRFTEEQLNEIDLLFNNNKKDDLISANGIVSITAKELIEKDLEPLNVVVENMLCAGFSILAGAPKVGKSWSCLDLCISVCNGKSFLGFNTNKSDCLYLALEDSEHRLKDRLLKVLGSETIPEGLNISTKCSPIDNGLINELEEYIQKYPNIKLIIIDTLQKVRGSQNRNDSCYSYDYKEIGKLKSFADEKKICILAIHHLRKQKDSDVFNQISGSTGLTGAADTSIVMSKLDNGRNEVLLSITGRDVESTEKIIKFDKDIFKWNIINDSINLEDSQQEERYNKNPIVITIKKMLYTYPEGYRTTASDLLKTIYSLTKTSPKQDSPQALSRYINETLQHLLLKYDGIYYESAGSNGGEGGRTLFFCRPITEEEN